MIRTKEAPVQTFDHNLLQQALQNPLLVARELNNRSLYRFLQYFWHIVSPHDFSPNWHIEYLCKELEKIAERNSKKLPREHDLIINVPPGSTKSITCSHIFPVWCWTKWYWMRFITASYSQVLALESAEYCRDILRSDEFKELYPEIGIKDDKDVKSNFKIVKKLKPQSYGRAGKQLVGGGRFSTSVGSTITGFHADILIVDDPLDPTQAASEVQLATANAWMDQTLPSRKTNKDNTPTILIMQRLHQNDVTGHWLAKQKKNVRHICIPGEAKNYKKHINPPELYEFYKNDLLDINRISWDVLKDLETDLGQYGYAGQIGQNPTPPGGGMFKVDRFTTINQNQMPVPNQILHTVRYWDKAATQGGGAYTAGVKMSKLVDGHWLVEDVVRGQWATHEREQIMRQTAEADGRRVEIWIEQEPGASGKDAVEASIRNLEGFVAKADSPKGDKEYRADPYSVQVNNGSVRIVNGLWNAAYKEELEYFPHGTYKDQVDASSGAFTKLSNKKIVRRIT